MATSHYLDQWWPKFHDIIWNNQTRVPWVNSLFSEKFCSNFFKVWFSNLLYRIVAWALPMKLFSGECHRTSQDVNNTDSGNGFLPPGNKSLHEQWWPRSMSPYGITRPQWVNDFFYYNSNLTSISFFLLWAQTSNIKWFMSSYVLLCKLP